MDRRRVTDRFARSRLARWVAALPVVGPLATRLYRVVVPPAPTPGFAGSRQYWVERYRRGGDSGSGSEGDLARFKAEVVNTFVREHEIADVIELGSGDGRQLALAAYPRYLGVDVSPEAVAACRTRFGDDPTKRFAVLDEDTGETAELALSLDVIYHLVEDEVYEAYMRRLFAAATRYVIVYSSDHDEQNASHVRQRAFTPWVREHAPQWRLVRRLPNPHPFDPATGRGSISDFWFFERVADDDPRA